MYEIVEVACKYCSGTGVGEYISEYGPFGFSVKDECHECEGEGIKITLIDPYESKDFEY
jgi:DnaJ-class molecular chaperone